MRNLINLDTSCEKGLLGCILLDNMLIYKAMSNLNEYDFIDRKHKIIYEVFSNLIINKKIRVDVSVAYHELKVKGITIKTILDLNEFTPTSLIIDSYINAIKSNSAKRGIINFYSNLKNEISNVNEQNFKDWIDSKEAQFREITDNYRGNKIKNDIISSKKLNKTIERYEYYYKNKSKNRGIKTGFNQLDNIIKGIKTLTILSSPSGIGKTTLATNWAVNITMKENIPVLYINYEMDKDELTDRIISSISEIKSDDIKAGDLFDKDWPILMSTVAKLNNCNLYYTGNEEKNIHDTISLIYQMYNKYGIKVVFIDYIGEIADDEIAKKEKTEYKIYGRYAQMLKNTCANLKIKCVLLCQIGRDGDEDPKRKNVQGSWKLIQKSDIFLILAYIIEKEEKYYKLKIEKNRHGLFPAFIKLELNKECHKFYEKYF